MNDWEGGEGMCQLHHVYHGWESTGSIVYITVSNTGMDVDLPLYPLIREKNLEMVKFILNFDFDYMFLTTSRSWFVRAHD